MCQQLNTKISGSELAHIGEHFTLRRHFYRLEWQLLLFPLKKESVHGCINWLVCFTFALLLHTSLLHTQTVERCVCVCRPTSEAHSWRVPTTGMRTSTWSDSRSLPSSGTAPVFSRACEAEHEDTMPAVRHVLPNHVFVSSNALYIVRGTFLKEKSKPGHKQISQWKQLLITSWFCLQMVGNTYIMKILM